ncbi:MAG: FHA domain-containing protein [Syntrophomonadaceae bacterium]
MNGVKCFIVIEQGEPYEKGTEIILSPGAVVLGRPWKDNQPDIPFISPHISKKHVELSVKNGVVNLVDLFSKHGTQINGLDIQPEKPYVLKNKDSVSLAKGKVQFQLLMHFESSSENTVDLNTSDLADLTVYYHSNSMVIDAKKREVYIDGQKIKFFGKEIELLLVLYENVNQATSIDEIKLRVWPERPVDPLLKTPDVGADEINSLVYRLRKRLTTHSKSIVTVPRYGYRLDI